MKIEYGCAFFILNENGRFSLKTVVNSFELDVDDLEDGDRIILKAPLSSKSLKAMEAIESIVDLEKITGASNLEDSLSGLIQWLIERAANSSFIVGRNIGRQEQSELHREIDGIISGEF